MRYNLLLLLIYLRVYLVNLQRDLLNSFFTIFLYYIIHECQTLISAKGLKVKPLKLQSDFSLMLPILLLLMRR